jgi:hypothetical protein
VLVNVEQLGDGTGPEVGIAVDPIVVKGWGLGRRIGMWAADLVEAMDDGRGWEGSWGSPVSIAIASARSRAIQTNVCLVSRFMVWHR